MNPRALGALAIADFRERARRPAYLVTLAAAVALGYLTIPPASSLFVVLDVGGHRGLYTSAYVGTGTAMAGALWLMLGGFYVVRSAIVRDEQTGVRQILAATPLRRMEYVLGKFVSNLMVLASMAGILAVAAAALQLARGESTDLDVGALLAPYLLFTVPVLAVTAACAVLFETVPGLRAGIGNIVWILVWMVLTLGGGGIPLGGLQVVARSMGEAMTAQGVQPHDDFSLGFTQVERPLDTFLWPGLGPDASFIAGRALLVVVAITLAALPGAWFSLADSGRGTRPHAADVTLTSEPDASATRAYRPAGVPRRDVVLTRVPATRAAGPLRGAGRLVAGELRILLHGTSVWWWLVLAVVNVVALVLPGALSEPPGAVTAALLSVAWIWPVLIWSRLGSQRPASGMETLLAACPGHLRQLGAEWGAGVVLTVLSAAGPLLRMALDTDTTAASAWVGAALLIPSAALVLGVSSRSHLPFQALYLLLWYAAVNQVAAANYMGTVFVDGRRAATLPLLAAVVALSMVAVALGVRAVRHAVR